MTANIEVDNRSPGTMAKLFPEVAAGGFSRRDGTVEFFGRIHALLSSDSQVLDYGAGRGQGVSDDPCAYRCGLRKLRGRCDRVVGVDISAAIQENVGVDEAVQIEPGAPLPFPDDTFDLIVSDHVFEHIDTPLQTAAELDRVLKPGGWICARTPNRWGYIALGARLVANRWHVGVLKRLQPYRQPQDVFPTRYRMNSIATLKRLFPIGRFCHHSYGYWPEPAYCGETKILWQSILFLERLIPQRFVPVLMVFIRKKQAMAIP